MAAGGLGAAAASGAAWGGGVSVAAGCADTVPAPASRQIIVRIVWRDIGFPPTRLFAAVFNQFNGTVIAKIPHRSSRGNALDPVIDCGRVPCHQLEIDFLGWIVGVTHRIRRFDFKGIESAGARCYIFLCRNRRSSRTLEAQSSR